MQLTFDFIIFTMHKMAFLPIYDSSLWKHCSIYFLSIYSFFGFKFSMAKERVVLCRIIKIFHFMFILLFLQLFIFVMYTLFELRSPITTYRSNIKNNNINIFKHDFKLLEYSRAIKRSNAKTYDKKRKTDNATKDIHFANKSESKIRWENDICSFHFSSSHFVSFTKLILNLAYILLMNRHISSHVLIQLSRPLLVLSELSLQRTIWLQFTGNGTWNLWLRSVTSVSMR